MLVPTAGMLLFTLFLLLEVEGEVAWFPHGEPGHPGESGHAGCSLHGQVLLQSLGEIYLRFRPPVVSRSMLPMID